MLRDQSIDFRINNQDIKQQIGEKCKRIEVPCSMSSCFVDGHILANTPTYIHMIDNEIINIGVLILRSTSMCYHWPKTHTHMPLCSLISLTNLKIMYYTLTTTAECIEWLLNGMAWHRMASHGIAWQKIVKF